MPVAPRAEPAAGRDHDLLDLAARPLVQDLEAAPGSLLRAMGERFRPTGRLQHRHQMTARLGPGPIGDQDRIVGLDHGQIAHARAGHQAPLGMDQTVLGLVQDDVALDCVARLVLGQLLPERLPGAEIRPAGIAGHDRDPRGALHHRLVDRLGRHRRVATLRHLPSLRRASAASPANACLDRVTDRGRMGSELGQDPIRPEQEDPAVPEIAALGEHRLGDRQLGLLDEARDPQDARRVGERLGRTDVAVARLGPGRRDAEGQQLARLGRRQGGVDRGVQRIRLAHQVVRGADPEQRIRRHPLAGVEGGERDCRGGVAAERLEQPVTAELGRDSRELALDQKILGLGADRNDPLGRRASEQATRRLLEQRLLAHAAAPAAWAWCRGSAARGGCRNRRRESRARARAGDPSERTTLRAEASLAAKSGPATRSRPGRAKGSVS